MLDGFREIEDRFGAAGSGGADPGRACGSAGDMDLPAEKAEEGVELEGRPVVVTTLGLGRHGCLLWGRCEWE